MAKKTATLIKVPEYGETFTDLGGRVGTATYDPNTGKALTPPKKTAVSVISTKKGKDALAPEIKNQQDEEMNLSNGTQNTTSVKTKPNSNSYSYEDLQTIGADMNNYSFDQGSNSFMEKPGTQSGDQASLTEADRVNKQYESDLKDIQSAFKTQQNKFDSAQNAVYDSIIGIYSGLAKEQKEANTRQYASYQNFGIREGGSRYAGEVTQGILNAEERAGLGRLQSIAAKQAEALASAKSAAASKSWEIFMEKRKEIQSLNTQRQKEIDTLRETGLKRLEEARERNIQVAREGAVSSLITQGITDPTEILETLNYDDAGNQIGDYTAEEVSKTYETLAGKSGYKNVEKLSGDLRDYFILKDMNQLPASIASLPEEQQLSAYLATFNPKKTTGGSGTSGNKITLAEADARKLPRSVVGMSEVEVAQSFYEATPPQWFIQKAQGEMRQSLLPTAIQSLWDSYRANYLGEGEEETTEEVEEEPKTTGREA